MPSETERIDALRRENAALAAALKVRNIALQAVWNRLLSVKNPHPEAWEECRSVIRDCRGGINPEDALAAYRRTVVQATVERVLALKPSTNYRLAVTVGDVTVGAWEDAIREKFADVLAAAPDAGRPEGAGTGN
ncbi:MAG TPA: hypothetical protein VM223_26490 [Planctomycetota bacterium]|nr:hypothetical protein [Planctomycetota bacterium]